MDIRDFKNEEIYQAGGQIDLLLKQLNMQEPNRIVIGDQSSVPQLLHDYIAAQTHTNNKLVEYISNKVAHMRRRWCKNHLVYSLPPPLLSIPL